MNRKNCTLLLSILLASCVPQSRAQILMTRHTRDVTLSGQAALLGRLPATQVMHLDVVLPLRNSAALDDFLAELYNPDSSKYRQFLTPAEFTEKFGPSQQDYDAVVRYVEDH